MSEPENKSKVKGEKEDLPLNPRYTEAKIST